MTHPRFDPDAAMALIARDTIREAQRRSACSCDVEDVRWDAKRKRAYIEHAPACPVRRAIEGEP